MIIRLHTPLERHFADIAEVAHIFYPHAQVLPAPPDACDLSHQHAQGADWTEDIFHWRGRSLRWTARVTGDSWERKRRLKRAIKQCCYYLLKADAGVSPPWGSLTGIRPTRLFYERLARGDSEDEAQQALVAMFDIQPGRARLLADTVRTQRGLIEAPERAVDLYIGIPFCTTRCTYCSFFAEAVGKGRKAAPYLDALLREMEETAQVVRERGLLPRALYVGGGTPTALTAEQLAHLLERFAALFPGVEEFTVEAGRPDTITGAKLAALRDAGVTRLSVNPQTMHDRTLAVIGRAHTAEDTRRAFGLARDMGFGNINMDIIAALPGETEADFVQTLRAIQALSPESLTVHALARKHGSVLNEFGFAPTDPAVAAAMAGRGAACAREMGMRPYYLYRQKYAAGNLENVGYALPGRENLYNIDLMEETTSVLAMGAGAISKRIFHGEARIERAPNVGDVGHYMTRVDEMIARKRRLWNLET